MNLGRYQLMRKLASGGMAEVYLAKAAGPMGFEKKLVVKRILPHLAEDESFIEMFFAEARLVARLDHPHIVQIFDFGEADGAYFIAMEYIDGLNLRILLKRVLAAGERLPIALCAKIISSACEGLAYAHEFVDPDTRAPLHLVHRDISPDNLLVSSHGAVKLADFGVAKAANQLHRTQTGAVKGKVAYMAPEQLKSKTLDARADLFALGVVFYELLSGHRPFEAENEMALMQAILHEEPVPVTRYREEVPAAVQHILARALTRDRDARYSSCRELQADLERFLRTVDEPVGPVDIARWVARFYPVGPTDALRTPSAKLLVETPAAPASASARTAPASEAPSRERDTEVLGKRTVAAGEPSVSDDSTRTDPSRTRLPMGAPPRWRSAVLISLAALLLASTGYGVWRALRPMPSPALATAPPFSAKTPAVAVAEPVASASPPVTPVVPPPQTPLDLPEAVSPAETQVKAKAFFRVESSIAGSVLVGGKSYGSTPATVTGLSPGQVTVEVRNKKKGFAKKRTVELAAGDNGTLEFTINKGRLSFHVLPYATVQLDDQELGDTPLPAVDVYEGPHTITLSNEKQGKTVRREFLVKPGDNEFTFNFNTSR